MNRAVSLIVLLSILFGGSILGQPVPVPAGMSRYRVTVDANSTDDVPALIRQLAAMCRGRVEPNPEPGFDGFVIVASEAAVRVLGSDSRVLRMEPLGDRPDAEPSSNARSARSRSAGMPSIVSAGVATTAATAAWTTGAYTYDGAGNISSIGRSDSAIGQRFVYDAFGRLTSGMAGNQKQTYTYDRFGNIRAIARASVSGTPQNPIPTTTSSIKLGADAETNRLSLRTIGNDAMNSSATYDDEGRLIEWHQSGGSFTYDALGMITTWSGANGNIRRYIYTPNDERLFTKVMAPNGTELSSEWTLRDASGKVLRRIQRSGGAWTWKQDYVYLNGKLLAAEVPTSAKTLHFFNDHLGTPRLITGNGGAQISRHDYLPFGEEITASYQDSERLKFTGHERDESALDYMHARYYSAGTARFLSVDPGRNWKKAMSRPQAWNRYGYALNNPVRSLDPDGKDDTDFRVMTARVNVIYSNADAQTRNGQSLRQVTEKGIAESRKFFVHAGINLDVRRYEGTINTGALGNVNGPVKTPGGQVELSSFVKSQPGALNVLVSGDLPWSGRTPGAGGPSAIGTGSGVATFNDELSHALGNVTTIRDPFGVANTLADTRLDLQEYLVENGFDMGEWYQETFRDTLDKIQSGQINSQ